MAYEMTIITTSTQPPESAEGTPTPSTPQTPPTPDMAMVLGFHRLPSLHQGIAAGGGGCKGIPVSEGTNPIQTRKYSCKCFPLPRYYNASDHDTAAAHVHCSVCNYAACAYPAIPSVSLSRKVGAEFIGTFMLIFAATASAIVNEKTGGSVGSMGLAASAGLAITIVILATGHISGAHVNSCLTLSFAALRHFPWIQVPAYVGAQIMASICASFLLKGVFHPDLQGGVTVPAGAQWQAFVLEFIISFNLMFVVTAVATDTRAVGELAGIAVGAVVTTNILIAGATSGASMNPVRTLGPAIAANNYKGLWLYIVGPITGALAGAASYTLVRLKGEDTADTPRRRSFRR